MQQRKHFSSVKQLSNEIAEGNDKAGAYHDGHLIKSVFPKEAFFMSAFFLSLYAHFGL